MDSCVDLSASYWFSGAGRLKQQFGFIDGFRSPQANQFGIPRARKSLDTFPILLLVGIGGLRIRIMFNRRSSTIIQYLFSKA